MADLLTAITQIQAAFRANVPGLKQVPDMPPEKASDYPFVVTFPNTGRHTWEMAGYRRDFHNLIIELHVARKDLPLDLRNAVLFAEKIPNALKTAERAGGLADISSFGVMNYTFGGMLWDDIETVGFRWTLADVMIETTVT